MTKYKIETNRCLELKQTSYCDMDTNWEKLKKRRKLGERRARLRALREDVVIHPSDVRPGDIIEIRKVRPRKRRDRRPNKWRVQYDDSGNGFMILTQEGNYYKEWADKYKQFYDEHGFPIDRQLFEGNSHYVRTALVAYNAVFSDIGDKSQKQYLEMIIRDGIKNGEHV